MDECRADEQLRARLGQACAPGGFLLEEDEPLDALRTFAILAESGQQPIRATLEEIVASWAAWLNLRDPGSARIAIRAVRACAHVWLVLRNDTPFDPAFDAGIDARMTRPPRDFYDAPDAITAIVREGP